MIELQILLVLSGGLYTFFAWKQWTAIKESTDISRRALVELEVPYVSIGEIKPHVLRENRDGESGPHPNAVIFFEFNLRNSGRSVAEVTSVHCDLRIIEKLPIPPDYLGFVDQNVFPIAPNSDTGKFRWLPSCKFYDDKSQEAFRNILVGTAQLVCTGYIRYKDAFGNKWISGFGWKWMPHNDGVTLVGGSYYNYRRKECNSGISVD